MPKVPVERRIEEITDFLGILHEALESLAHECAAKDLEEIRTIAKTLPKQREITKYMAKLDRLYSERPWLEITADE
jgi:hypothetical protein